MFNCDGCVCFQCLCLFATLMFSCHACCVRLLRSCVFSSCLCLRLPILYLLAVLVDLRLFAIVSCVVAMLVFVRWRLCLLSMLVLFDCHSCYVWLQCLTCLLAMQFLWILMLNCNDCVNLPCLYLVPALVVFAWTCLPCLLTWSCFPLFDYHACTCFSSLLQVFILDLLHFKLLTFFLSQISNFYSDYLNIAISSCFNIGFVSFQIIEIHSCHNFWGFQQWKLIQKIDP